MSVHELDVRSPQDLILLVPEDIAHDVGVRWPASLEDAEDVLEVLARSNIRVPSSWSRRFKNHQDKLKSGDLYDCAEVVRNLAVRQRSKRLAPAESAMYAKARHTLVAELALSWDTDFEDADARVESALTHASE
jgi:CarD family transcriptional regulator